MSSNPAKSPIDESVSSEARLITIDGSFDGECTGVRPKMPAPKAATERRAARTLTPWLAALAGSLVTAAGFVLAGTMSQPPTQVSPASVGVTPVLEQAAGIARAATQQPFERELAEQTAGIALRNARNCGLGPDTEIAMTFAPDGSVQRMDAHRPGGLDSRAGACMEEYLAGVRIPAFHGDPAVVRLVAR